MMTTEFPLSLRWYQVEAIVAVEEHMREKPTSHPCIVLPTGAGKTVVMAAMIHRYVTAIPGTRILILAHVRELVQQNASKLLAAWPEAPVGIYSASLKRRDLEEPVIFASIQSVHRKALHLGAFDLVFVDEAHRIPHKGDGMYRKFLADVERINPNVRIIGFTATPYRLGVGEVVGDDKILNKVCFEAPVGQLIQEGHLCTLIGKRGIVQADTTGVAVRGGEFDATELERAVNRGDLVGAAMDEVVELCRDRTAWLLFAAGVDHAHAVAAALEERGIKAPVIHAGTPTGERDFWISRYNSRELRALVNVNVLSEGFDSPHVDAVIMLRPTKSPGLYYQQVGRGLRNAKGKANCLVLDYAGNVERLGAIDSIKVKKKRKRGEAAAQGATMRACPECRTLWPISVLECLDCGYIWPAAPPHQDKASTAPVLSTLREPESVRVGGWEFCRHEKEGKPPSMRVEYWDGHFRVGREWICVEHGGYARQKAVMWWARMVPGIPCPTTVDDAISAAEMYGRCPARIMVQTSGRFDEVIGHVHDAGGERAGDCIAESRAPGAGAAADAYPMLPV